MDWCCFSTPRTPEFLSFIPCRTCEHNILNIPTVAPSNLVSEQVVWITLNADLSLGHYFYHRLLLPTTLSLPSCLSRLSPLPYSNNGTILEIRSKQGWSTANTRTYVSAHELTDLLIKWAEIAAGEKSRSRKDTTSEGAAMILIIEIHNSYAVSSRIYIGGK
jgi:hypothetical protein